MIVDKLGMSPEDRTHLVENLDVIINSAASVNFDDPLQDALSINYFGSQRMLELAKECKHLDVFTHISTCYVNCNRTGLIEEKIYDLKMDVESQIKHIMSMNKIQIAENEKQILGVFPNTYTFTKNLAEKSLMKNRGHVTVCLVRPAIIASSLREPFPGWTDSLSAAGGISLMTGLGLINYLKARGDNKFDIIPVDIVTNQIITATAYGSLTKN